MATSSLSMFTESVTSIITLGGTALTNSMKYVDLDDVDGCRWQYIASQSISVRIEYSLDEGVTWNVFADEYETFGTSPRITSWQVIPEEAKRTDVLLRAFVIGSGLLTTISFVEFQYR